MDHPKPPIQDWPEKVYLSLPSCPETEPLTVAGINSFVTGRVYSPVKMELLI